MVPQSERNDSARDPSQVILRRFVDLLSAGRAVAITDGVEGWDHRGGLAHVPPHGGNGPAELGHDPRLLASRQSQREHQVLTGGVEDEAECLGEAGRGDSANALPAGER